VIVPSEGIDKSNSPDYHFVAPIKALEPNEAWSRSFARSRLSVPDSAKVVYVQLGAGVINEIEDILQQVLEGLFAYDDVHVVLGESMLGQRLSFSHERLRVIRDYPNSLYAHAFDASVQAGGYNSYQEMRMFGVPTLFIPNTETGMDDQVARCKESEKEGWGTVYLPGEERIEQKISELLEISADPIPSENGVHSVIKLLGIELP
jgi:UDP-N-acetylglucosamine--N-acetylmuramyl-(pentapeptide) pyrophosphoryl-undecaprenol N-acetylglucosamine transferase